MFKRYDQKQQFLLPLNLEEFVSEDHISRVLNDLIDIVDISAIESTYSENVCPAYHPRLFLKILFYGYLINTRSSRKIAGMTQTDTAFMYLAAMQKPDFRTICRFRSTHLDSIKEIFSQIVTFCKEMGLISVEYPASLLRGWKTSPRTVNNNTIYQFRFRFVNFCSN